MDFFSPLNTSFYTRKACKRFPENAEFAEMRQGDVINFYNDFTDRRVASVRPTCDFSCFFRPHGLERVCELDLSQTGKNNGNPDLVCEKYLPVHQF